jgi:class 3 adenylate cyclase
MTTTRRLAAILAADVAGYSRLIGADEDDTLERLRALRRELLDPKIAEHKGRLVKTTGDGLLVEFASVVDALRCAVEVQSEMADRNAGVTPDNRIEFRVGINVGDIVVEDGDIFGDGVNVAMGSMSRPGSKLWPSPVASASRRGCRKTPRASSTSSLMTSANSSSRISHDRFGPTGWSRHSSRRPRAPVPALPSLTSHRLRCCRLRT